MRPFLFLKKGFSPYRFDSILDPSVLVVTVEITCIVGKVSALVAMYLPI